MCARRWRAAAFQIPRLTSYGRIIISPCSALFISESVPSCLELWLGSAAVHEKCIPNSFPNSSPVILLSYHIRVMSVCVLIMQQAP